MITEVVGTLKLSFIASSHLRNTKGLFFKISPEYEKKIFRLLKGVQGPLEVRKQFVEFAIGEEAMKARD